MYDDIGSTISVYLVGPFGKSTNVSRENIVIDAKVADGKRVTKYFDIERLNRDPRKFDKVTFNLDIDPVATQPNLSLQFIANAQDAFSFHMYIDTHSLDTRVGAICGAIILILLNVLIISEVHKKIPIWLVFG